MWRDLERICESLGLPFARPSVFPRNGLLAARIVTAFNGALWIPKFVKAVYQANFVTDRDISERAIITDCLLAIRVEAEPIISVATGPAARPAFRAQIESAKQQNIFGAPSFVSHGELFWGNDRLDQAVKWHVDHRSTDM